jgi:hypothetical protein
VLVVDGNVCGLYGVAGARGLIYLKLDSSPVFTCDRCPVHRNCLESK